MDFMYLGAYAEYVAVSTKMLVHKPKQLSWEEAAGVPEVSEFYKIELPLWIYNS